MSCLLCRHSPRSLPFAILAPRACLAVLRLGLVRLLKLVVKVCKPLTRVHDVETATATCKQASEGGRLRVGPARSHLSSCLRNARLGRGVPGLHRPQLVPHAGLWRK